MKNTYLYYITSGLSFLLVSLSFIKNDIYLGGKKEN